MYITDIGLFNHEKNIIIMNYETMYTKVLTKAHKYI